VSSGDTAFRERPPQVEELVDALFDLELEAALDATESGIAAEWWAWVGQWLSAVVFALAGATTLLAFVTLRVSDPITSTTLGVSALFLAFALGATLWSRPGAAGAAASTRHEVSRRYMETVRRFRRTEARFLNAKDAWQRYDALASILASIKAGRLGVSDIDTSGEP
jgi:hypothetical protein